MDNAIAGANPEVVCVYVCVHTHIHTYIHIHTYTYIYIHTYREGALGLIPAVLPRKRYVRVRMCTCVMCVWVCMYVCGCWIYVYTHIYTCIHVSTYLWTSRHSPET